MEELLTRMPATVQSEFGDLPSLEQFTRATFRIVAAVCLGAPIGYERELRRSLAGLRTRMRVAARRCSCWCLNRPASALPT